MLAGGKSASDPVAVSETTRGSCLHFDGVQDMHDFNYSMQLHTSYIHHMILDTYVK